MSVYVRLSRRILDCAKTKNMANLDPVWPKHFECDVLIMVWTVWTAQSPENDIDGKFSHLGAETLQTECPYAPTPTLEEPSRLRKNEKGLKSQIGTPWGRNVLNFMSLWF